MKAWREDFNKYRAMTEVATIQYQQALPIMENLRKIREESNFIATLPCGPLLFPPPPPEFPSSVNQQSFDVEEMDDEDETGTFIMRK